MPTLIAEQLQSLDNTLNFTLNKDTIANYAHDQGPILELHQPLAVIWPESVEQVQTVAAWANRNRIALIARGAGTGVSGAANVTQGAVVLSFEKMNQILDIRPVDEVAVVQPGVINAELNRQVAKHGLMYAPDPASFEISTIGGNVGTNAGGLRCAKYGVTRDSVLALDVVLADGTLIHTGHDTFKGVAGYDLTSLFVGSEGTLGLVVAITVRLRHLPSDVRDIAAFFPDLAGAGAGVQAIGKARVQPAIVELLNANALASLDARFGTRLKENGGALLLVQCDGFGAQQEVQLVRDALISVGGTVDNLSKEQARELIDLRRNSRGLGNEERLRVGEDVVVPRSKLVDYIAALERIAQAHDVQLDVVSHAGDGNLHPSLYIVAPENLSAEEEAVLRARLDAALDQTIDEALAFGGTITGEHGVGQYKLRWLGQEQSPEVIQLQRQIKKIFDPEGILNPGKAIL